MKSSQLLKQDEFGGLQWQANMQSFVLSSREAITLTELRTLLSGRDFGAYQVYKDKILQDGYPRLLDGKDLGH